MNAPCPEREELTIPPATDLAFQIYVSEICDRAEIDREDRVLQAYEFQTHLHEAWREGFKEGLTSDQAQQRAIERFGSVESVARSLGGNELKALILNENDRTLRLVAFIVYCVLVFLVRVLVQDPPNAMQTIASIPEFVGEGFVAVAIFYLVVRIWRMGLSMDNFLKVHVISPMLMMIQTRFPDFYDRWRPVFALVGRGSGNPSVIFKYALILLQVAGLFLALYLTRNFMKDFIIWPYKAFILQWGRRIPACEDWHYLWMCGWLSMVWVQAVTILIVGAELFEWWRDKRFSNNKYLHWLFYIFPGEMKDGSSTFVMGKWGGTG
jgi:hypothetical protein